MVDPRYPKRGIFVTNTRDFAGKKGVASIWDARFDDSGNQRGYFDVQVERIGYSPEMPPFDNGLNLTVLRSVKDLYRSDADRIRMGAEFANKAAPLGTKVYGLTYSLPPRLSRGWLGTVSSAGPAWVTVDYRGGDYRLNPWTTPGSPAIYTDWDAAKSGRGLIAGINNAPYGSKVANGFISPQLAKAIVMQIVKHPELLRDGRLVRATLGARFQRAGSKVRTDVARALGKEEEKLPPVLLEVAHPTGHERLSALTKGAVIVGIDGPNDKWVDAGSETVALALAERGPGNPLKLQVWKPGKPAANAIETVAIKALPSLDDIPRTRANRTRLGTESGSVKNEVEGADVPLDWLHP